MPSKKGVTLIELLAVTVIMGILAVIATVLIGNLINNTRLSADQQSLINLNYAMSLYDVEYPNQKIAESGLSNEEVFTLLVEKGYLSHIPILQSKNSEFVWDLALLVFKLNIRGDILPLTIYGDTYEEIVPEIVNDMKERLATEGNYGRTWDKFQYTDVGLDPEDWEGYFLHIHYRPSGSSLLLEVEDGYQFVFNKMSGTKIILPSSRKWNLIYNLLDEKWYYHSINSPDNEIDINTLVVELT